jgi:hypothetical protein
MYILHNVKGVVVVGVVVWRGCWRGSLAWSSGVVVWRGRDEIQLFIHPSRRQSIRLVIHCLCLFHAAEEEE